MNNARAQGSASFRPCSLVSNNAGGHIQHRKYYVSKILYTSASKIPEPFPRPGTQSSIKKEATENSHSKTDKEKRKNRNIDFTTE